MPSSIRRFLESKWLILGIFFAALTLRLCFFNFASHDYETFLAPWVEKFRTYGPIAGFSQDFSDYNMPYLYILSLISLIPLPDLYLIKAVSVIFDFLLAYAVYLNVSVHGGNKLMAVLGLTLSLFVPTSLLNSSMWAQCDSLYVSLLLLAYYAVLKNKPITSFVLAGIAFSFKLQTIFFLPIYAVFWMTKHIKFKHFFAFPAAYIVMILPAVFFGKPIGDILGVYTKQVDEYSHLLQLNAPSVFAFIPNGTSVDTNLFMKLGIVAAALFICIVLFFAWHRRTTLSQNDILIFAYLLCAGIPFLLPSMHDRYFYLADQMSIILVLILPKLLLTAPLTLLASYSAYHAYLSRRWLFGASMAFPAFLMLLAICTAAAGAWFIPSGKLHKTLRNTR